MVLSILGRGDEGGEGEGASKTQEAASSLYVINHEGYRSHIVDAYDEVSCHCNGS